MPEKHPMGWLIEVRAGSPGLRRGRFAVLADNLQRASALVGDFLKVTSQRVELVRILTDGEVSNLGLRPGEVREYAPQPLRNDEAAN
jgi:hypothetical protein